MPCVSRKTFHFTYICVYIYIHTHTHTHIYIYIYIYSGSGIDIKVNKNPYVNYWIYCFSFHYLQKKVIILFFIKLFFSICHWHSCTILYSHLNILQIILFLPINFSFIYFIIYFILKFRNILVSRFRRFVALNSKIFTKWFFIWLFPNKVLYLFQYHLNFDIDSVWFLVNLILFSSIQ